MTGLKSISALLVALFAGCTVAAAAPINITVDSTGALLNGSGVANESQYGQTNNNPGSDRAFLVAMITIYNAAIDPDVPTPPGSLALDVGSIGGASSYTVLTGYQYVVLHFGAGQAGGRGVSPGGWWQAWYLDGQGGVFTTPQVSGKSVGGFSSARYYGTSETVTIPDGGFTLMLLGSALVGLGMLRRKLTN